MEDTSIQKFYKNTNVFITGGTGFMGKILIERLLRSTQIETLYLLVRNKKGKNIHVRIDELFDDVVFDRLKKECPKFRHKVEAISGDCTQSGLGLNITDRQTLISKVNIVFHVAATVKFDENLKLAYNINVNGTKSVLDLARQMNNLVSMVHVSTAYSHCPRLEVEEKIYDCPLSYEYVQAVLEKIGNEEAHLLTPRIIGEWPNTYTFTKALAENMVKDLGKNLPLAIFRPSIVLSTYKEPIEGWIDNLYGPTGCAAGVYTGIMRVAMCVDEAVADVVPVDTCVAALIATAWEVSTKKCEPSSEISVYNYVSQPENPVHWKELIEINLLYNHQIPSSSSFYEVFIYETANLYLFWFLVLALHGIPGVLIDFLAILTGHKPRMLGMYRKIHKFTVILSYFSTRSWRFSNNNIRNLWKKLDERDKELFQFSMTTVHWLQFFRTYLRGVRRYLLHEPDNTIEDAKKRQRWLFILHNGLKAILSFCVCSTALSVCSKILSLVY
ncbi:fatty acyl-CoA reductase wat-like [Diabrotica undecimpunctata]|uniref:fatty acyl-CoA reductase wat-like n=1 Tax=Diabrotica undecimpunctata TaxID=50387 RepID=UPI003B634EDE